LVLHWWQLPKIGKEYYSTTMIAAAVKYGCGHLNTRSLGYLLRFYLFVFYFGVSTPTRPSGWGLVNGHDHYLLNDPRSSGQLYLPGEAPQTAILSMKDLIKFLVARLRSLTLTDQMAYQMLHVSPIAGNKLKPDTFNRMIDELVGGVVAVLVYRVNISNYTQLAMHQIHRSGGSELFWYTA
jgi:hypothetical protein